MNSHTEIVHQSVYVGAAAVSYAGLITGLICLVLVVVVLVKIFRLVATGRTRSMAAAQPAGLPEPAGAYAPGTQLRSLRLTMSASAFLVPMAIAVFLAAVVAAIASPSVVPSENPFGIHLMSDQGSGGTPSDHARSGHEPLAQPRALARGRWVGDHPQNMLILGLIAVCLAGHVGLLRAAYANRTPSSADFLQGIKDHTFTFILGKLLLCVGIVAISSMIGYRVTWTGILFVVPSLLLAPLVGTAALHPREPLQAIKAALSHSTGDVHGTGKLVTIQILMLVGAWIIYGAVQSHPNSMLQIPLLANGSSTLSFNTFPMMAMFRGGFGELLVIGFTVVSSTVFLGCHFLKVMDRVRETAEEAAAATTGHAA